MNKTLIDKAWKFGLTEEHTKEEYEALIKELSEALERTSTDLKEALMELDYVKRGYDEFF